MEKIQWDKALEKARISIATGCELVVTFETLNPAYASKGGLCELTGRCRSIQERWFELEDFQQIYSMSLVECRYKDECSDCDGTSFGAVIEGICNPCAVMCGWLILPEE